MYFAKIALEEAGEYGLETDAALIDFAKRFLARVDEIRGKYAVAHYYTNTGEVAVEVGMPREAVCRTIPLFLSPTIPDECLMSWDGKNIRGDKASIQFVRQAIHEAGNVPQLKERIKQAEGRATIPEGYALVPVEPTEAMIQAAKHASDCGVAYKAMLQAAGEKG